MRARRQTRTSWNWPRVLKKYRTGLIAALSSLPLLVFIGVIYLLMALESLINLVYRRIFRLPPVARISAIPRRRSQQAGQSNKRIAVLNPGVPGHAAARPVRLSEASERQRSGTESEERAREAANQSVLSNLEMCLSPAAVLVVAEEAVHRHELHWPGLEGALARLVDLDASADDARSLMATCHYEWLYEMATEPRRIIRLVVSPGTGRFRWRHAATHLICFEYDGGSQLKELLPPVEQLIFQNRLCLFFSSRGRLVHWERPCRRPQRGL
jgi:hypothetical protein